MRWLLIVLLGVPVLVWAQKPPASAQKENFIRFVRLAPWSQKENLVDLVQPGIALRPKALEADTLVVGASKYGGRPDLPADWAWPEFEGHPMVFFAQFDLEHMAKLASGPELPVTGTLYFFAWFPSPAANGPTQSAFLKNRPEYRVLWYEGRKEELRRRDYPAMLPGAFRFAATRFHPVTAFGLPGWNDWRIERLQLPERDLTRLADFSGVYGVEEDHLLGYAYPLRDDLTWDWSLMYLGFGPNPLSTEQRQAVQYLRGDFIHLLSFELQPTFQAIGTAKAYWGIRRQDLAQKDFSKAVLVLQDM